MNIKVVYHTTTGNTRKVAEAVAAAAGVKAESIEDSELSSAPVDLLFVGDGLYGGKPHKKTVAFISSLDPGKVKNAAVFATYGGQARIGEELKKHFQEKGIHLIGEPFTCRGRAWIFINRSHPDESDLNRARAFAKAAVKEWSGNV